MTMTGRQKRAFRRQFDSQVEQERNGAPVPPEIAARMTKSRPARRMYQVAVDWMNDDGTKEMIAVSPAVDQKDFADVFCSMLESQLGCGRMPWMRNPRVVPLLPQGVI